MDKITDQRHANIWAIERLVVQSDRTVEDFTRLCDKCGTRNFFNSYRTSNLFGNNFFLCQILNY